MTEFCLSRISFFDGTIGVVGFLFFMILFLGLDGESFKRTLSGTEFRWPENMGETSPSVPSMSPKPTCTVFLFFASALV